MSDEVSSSGYSSSFNADYYPVQTDTMDTEDYELYDPRIHAARPTRIVQPRVANKVKPREVDNTSSSFVLSVFPPYILCIRGSILQNVCNDVSCA